MINLDVRYKSHHDALNEYSTYSQQSMSSIDDVIANFKVDDKDLQRSHAIYIHVPFCDRICSFCNLTRKMVDDTLEEYHQGVLAQIEKYQQNADIRKLSIGSIYFGGGTPTTLAGPQMVAIINKIRDAFNIENDCEISVETTIHNLDVAKLKQLQDAGVNRLSIGIQTFSNEGRKYFNRTYDQKGLITKIHQVKEVFKGVITMDKIYNYHNESKEALIEDVKLIKELDFDSISFYSLMIHKGSALSKSEQYNEIDNTNDFEYHNLFLDEMMKDNQYHLLEITKVINNDKDRYRYITTRNQGGYTIPLGSGAGGILGSYQIMNVDFNRVMAIKETNPLMRKADLLYGLLQFNQFNLDHLLDEFVDDEVATIKSILDELIKLDMLVYEGDNYHHTRKGLFYGNNVCAFLVKQFLNSYEKTTI